MEIYRNTVDAKLRIEVPERIITAPGTSVTVVAVEENRIIHEFEAALVTEDLSGFYVELPWEIVNEDRDFYVDWIIDYTQNGTARDYRERQFVQVISPVLPILEVQDINSPSTPAEAADLERKIRYTIQTYTGQNFGRYRTTVEVPGTGTNTLLLPAPLLAIVDTSFKMSNLILANNGWAIKGQTGSWLSIKDAPPEDLLDQFYYTNGPIQVGANTRSFVENREYQITGLWGYHDVPADIKQAARILAEDYSCDESLWRERYIESVRSGNWRFEISKGAFAGTGNVLVDQLLLPYRRLTMRIV